MKNKLLSYLFAFSGILLAYFALKPSYSDNDKTDIVIYPDVVHETLQKAQGRPKEKMSDGELEVLQDKLARREKRLLAKESTSKALFNGASSFANGTITGTWDNVKFTATGRWGFGHRTIKTAYDKEHHTIYVVSHAGHLWKINKGIGSHEYIESEVSWTPLDIKRSYRGFLAGINPDENSFRLLWSDSTTMKYSDDEGTTWNTSSNLMFSSNSTQGAITEHNGINQVVIVGKVGTDYIPHYSTDNGTSFTQSSFSLTSSGNTMRVVKPHNSNDIYMLIRNSSSSLITVYKWDYTLNTFDLVQSPTFAFSGLNRLLATYNDDNMHFYVASGKNIYYSGDEGTTWTLTNSSNSGTGDVMPREVNPLNPAAIFSGYLDVRKSANYGESFSGTGHYLGWDVHHIKAYEKKDGTPFLFIGNDFGTSFSYTPETFSSYIKLNNLSPTMMCYDSDNSQHYKTFFTATQDRGSRGGTDNDSGITGTNELRSTDGLRVTLSGNEKGIWTWMYFGTIYHKDNFGIKSSNLKSNNFTNTNWWASAMVASPNLSEDAVYIASGSSLTKLTYNRYSESIIKISHGFDFSTLTSQSLTGFGYSPIDTNKWYVSVKNGDLFYSEDGGLSFTQATINGGKPRANDQSLNYNKNQHVIKGSRLDANKVYYAGVTSNGGSSGTKFMISTDGGKTFNNHSNGLNAWRIRSFDMSPDEKYIYAACATAGLWVYSVDDDMWYEMDDENVPQVDFTNVEYIIRDDKVRFSSYGNGILNFTLDQKLKSINYPSNLQIVSDTNTNIELTWVDNADNETGFYVQKTRDDINWETVATLGVNTTSYSDSEIAGTDYITYRVIAFNATEESNPSNYVVSLSRSALPNKSGWELISTDSHRSGLEGEKAFDGDLSTYWMTEWNNAPAHPHEIVIDMHETINIKALGWYNRQDHPNGRVGQYEFYASTDLNNWGTPVAESTWTDTADEIITSFPETTARYLKFVALSSTNMGTINNLTSCAEISVYKEVPAPKTPQPPYAPEIVLAKATGDNTGQIRFIDSSNNEDGFYLEQLIDGNFERVQTLSPNSYLASLSNLNPGTVYTFRMASYNDVGQSSYSSEVSLLTQGEALSVDDFTTKIELSVSPNPFTNRLVINTGNSNNIKAISLYDLSGRKIIKQTFSNSAFSRELEINNNIPTGVYILKMNINGNRYSKKIVKK